MSASAVYPFTVNADRTLVANFVPTYTIATSASPVAGGGTSGGGTFNSGDSVTVAATANAGYNFVNWTEGGVEVSACGQLRLHRRADRTLVANFTPKVVNLQIVQATASRSGNKVFVTVTVKNVGGQAAQAVRIATKKDAVLAGKTTSGAVPVLLGDIFPDHSVSPTLTFSAVKAGTRTLQVRLNYTGGVALLSAPVAVP